MKIKKLHPDAVLPNYVTDGASAFDVFAYEDVEWVLGDEFWEAVIPTGWAFEIPISHNHENGLHVKE